MDDIADEVGEVLFIRLFQDLNLHRIDVLETVIPSVVENFNSLTFQIVRFTSLENGETFGVSLNICR